MPENQGLSAIAFFEVTAFLILLVLFILFRKDHPTRFLTIWITGWSLMAKLRNYVWSAYCFWLS